MAHRERHNFNDMANHVRWVARPPGLLPQAIHIMLKAGLIVVFGIVVPPMALAQSDVGSPKAPRKTMEKPLSRAPKPCAEYGAGFVKLEGSDTCVRLGGSISVGAGGGSGVRGGLR